MSVGASRLFAAGDAGFGVEGGGDFFFGGPPFGAFDLSYAVADDALGGLDAVEATGVATEEACLVVDGKLAFLHHLNGRPSVVAVVVIYVGGPCKDVLVELGEAGRRGLIALETGDAMLEEGLTG